MATTEAELKKLRTENQRKRQQLRKASAEKWHGVEDDNNELLATQLETENARLEAEIQAAKNTAKQRKEGSGPLEQARERLARAKGFGKAQDESAETRGKAATAAKDDKEKN